MNRSSNTTSINQEKNHSETQEFALKSGGEKNIGGFTAMPHSIAKLTYGPKSTLPSKSKVFFLILHHTLGNWTVKISLSNSFISKETGVSLRNVPKIIHDLELEGMILVERKKVGPLTKQVSLENIYQLHPEYFGDNPLYQGDFKKPTFQVIPGGKVIHNNQEGSDKYGSTPPDKTVTTPPAIFVTTQQGQEPPPERKEPSDKNLLRMSKNLSEEKEERFDQTLDKKDWSEVRPDILRRCPGEEISLDKIYRELQLSGIDDFGNPIGCLPAFMWSCYEQLREARKNPYPERPKKQEEVVERTSPDKVKGFVDEIFKNMGVARQYGRHPKTPKTPENLGSQTSISERC